MEKMARLFNIRTRRRVLSYLLFVLIGSYCITVIARMRCTEVYRNTLKRITFVFNIPDDVSCYRSDDKMDELKFIKSHAIYMISASCDKSLSAHQACVIESVLQAHGYEKHVYVFFTKPVEECMCSEDLVKELMGISQLHFITIQIDKFVEDTPFKDIFYGEFLNLGLDREARVAEYLKFAALYKFRGVVLDLDMIMARPVYNLGLNWGVLVNIGTKSSNIQLGTAAVALNTNTQIGKSLLERTMELMKEARSDEEVDGGDSLTEAYKQLCYGKPDTECYNFRIYDAELFYPFNWENSDKIFRKGDLAAEAYGYFVWDRTESRLRRGSIYVKLMREYCPNIAGYLDA